MKVGEAIERADALRPNPFSSEEKMQWLSEIDGKISKQILKRDDFKAYELKDFRETKLLAEDAYTDIYLFYLCAMIDFFSRDYGEYNNSVKMFNSLYEKYAKEKHSNSEDKNYSGVRSDKYYINIF